mmetsp:Transcript_27365/g.60585  ORF Transcript_27365/g.60585 Transcript_27365/m.60585 type:complete len:484 (+) Transcript_27365:118-1569(+)
MLHIRALLLVALLVAACSEASINSLTQLSYDENNRLSANYLLHSDTPECLAQMAAHVTHFREKLAISKDLENQFFDGSQSACAAVCLEQGMEDIYVTHPLPKALAKEAGASPNGLTEWLTGCQKVEVGFISYHPQPLDLYWLNGKQARVSLGQVKWGEKNTVWQQTYLGHQFVLVDSVTQADVLALQITHDSVYAIGTRASAVVERDVASQVKQTLKQEWSRAHSVQRTFTEFGFHKGRLPDDLWGSISAYYYNNRQHTVTEEWEGKGLYVNWWERDVHFIPMPWELKRYWQRRLKDLVQQWAGVDLELTDIYGMRQYNDGARLLTHVDRESTHAASLIINVGQSLMREPWQLEIYDFADRLHEVEMVPGDIVYYESARCLHGRMRPLQGESYVNLFAHYRPTGDPNWYSASNPADAPEQALDIGTCTSNGSNGPNGSGVTCSEVTPPFLSPSLAKLSGPADLYAHWEEAGRTRSVPVPGDEL